MEVESMHIRHCILHYFHRGENAAETCRIICNTYGEQAVSKRTCQVWFSRFRKGNFDISDKPRCGRPQEMKDEDLEALLAKDESQSSVVLAKKLAVNHTTVLRRLHALGKIHRKGKWVSRPRRERAIDKQRNNQPDNHSDNQPENQPNNQPDNQPNNQPDSQPNNQPDNQPNNQLNNQPDNQLNNQPDNQLNNHPENHIYIKEEFSMEDSD